MITSAAVPDGPLLISGATLIDGVATSPLSGLAIKIDRGRISNIGRRDDFGAFQGAILDLPGKYLIPGLMNANVHLIGDASAETLSRYIDQYDDLIIEAAQIALAAGQTTVFDTWGPRGCLTRVRDQINSGGVVGSRILCAGNIIGLDGPFSPDFNEASGRVVRRALSKRINAAWVENVGRHLMWLSPPQVAAEIRLYISRGIDFVKYASNEHYGTSAGAFIAFSLEAQRAIVEEAHGAKLTAQAHTMSVEGLRLAVEAGCDLIQHANLTGPVPIPRETRELLAQRNVGVVVFPLSERRLEQIRKNPTRESDCRWQVSDVNTKELLRSGAPILMATDGAVHAGDASTLPSLNEGNAWMVGDDDNLFSLATGHFSWLEAMQEKGGAAMDMLHAATRNVALAYGVDDELGTIQLGKAADILVLNRNPLEDAANYRSIHTILKEGRVVDRSKLPSNPVLTRAPSVLAEEGSYVSFFRTELMRHGCRIWTTK